MDSEEIAKHLLLKLKQICGNDAKQMKEVAEKFLLLLGQLPEPADGH